MRVYVVSPRGCVCCWWSGRSGIAAAIYGRVLVTDVQNKIKFNNLFWLHVSVQKWDTYDHKYKHSNNFNNLHNLII